MARKSASKRYKIASAVGLAKAQRVLDENAKAGLKLDAISSHGPNGQITVVMVFSAASPSKAINAPAVDEHAIESDPIGEFLRENPNRIEATIKLLRPIVRAGRGSKLTFGGILKGQSAARYSRAQETPSRYRRGGRQATDSAQRGGRLARRFG
jgi:N-acetylglucosamine kinase-like BadF-type ATPase